eukprot:gene17970-biopygen36721
MALGSVWKLWNSVTGRKRKSNAQPGCSADKCGEAFLHKIERIREPLLSHPLRVPTRRNIPLMSEFMEVTEREVREAIERDKGTKSVGVDEIPMSILKRVGPELAPEIAAIATACVKAGKWPEQWKKAEIVPIWKNKGNQQDPLFYRPISMLPAIARLVERVLAEQLKAHIALHAVLPAFQHGFRARHSTETALIHLIDGIATGVDDGDVVLVASMDLAGAFDTLDRGVLTRKLEEVCGIAGNAKALIQDYLEGRMQRVRKCEEIGGWKENPWGVPQGSVLGPLLFSLYCADMGEAVRSAEICQYADDVTLTVTSETAQGAVSKMNEALAEFHEWATGNR